MLLLVRWMGTWVTRLECRRRKSRGPEGFQGPEARRPLAIVFLLSILLYFFVGQTDGEERQTKSEPHLRSLGLSGHFHNCPPQRKNLPFPSFQYKCFDCLSESHCFLLLWIHIKQSIWNTDLSNWIEKSFETKNENILWSWSLVPIPIIKSPPYVASWKWGKEILLLISCPCLWAMFADDVLILWAWGGHLIAISKC